MYSVKTFVAAYVDVGLSSRDSHIGSSHMSLTYPYSSEEQASWMPMRELEF